MDEALSATTRVGSRDARTVRHSRARSSTSSGMCSSGTSSALTSAAEEDTHLYPRRSIIPPTPRLLDARGKWTKAVAYEATRSARVLPALDQVPAEGGSGKAIEISDESEIQHANAIRRAVFGSTDDDPLKQLGEA
ncbi:hypothetical protein [Actinosynnema sp. NPDC023587]|uniref:hypothetical protein n=1 Tax=Actinosynnema sp. NPDC023587 TaxID=3154695 RepID=UPI003407FD99